MLTRDVCPSIMVYVADQKNSVCVRIVLCRKFFPPHIHRHLTTQTRCSCLMRLTRDYISRSESDGIVMAKLIRECEELLQHPQECRELLELPRNWSEKLSESGVAGLPLSQIPNYFWAYHIIHNRLVVVLQPLRPLSATIEEETQILAQTILVWDAKMLRDSKMYYPSFAVHMARTVQLSKDEWMAAVKGNLGSIDSKNCIAVNIFEQWRDMLCGFGAVKRCIKL